ncbi:MAG: DUF4340 domain-containing protein [Verrucomicrobiota bacterium]
MKTKTTLILLAVAVAGGLYIKFYESKKPNTEEARRQAQNVINFDRQKVDGIVIQNGDDRIELRRQENKWRLEAPIKDQADNGIVENLLAELESWQKDSSISAKDLEADRKTLDEFGLGKPKLRLKLLGPENSPEILFGKDAALEGKMYVRFADSKDALIASQAIRNDAAKKPEEFRDKKLTDLTTAQVSRVLVKTAAGEMELQKKGDHWNIVKPLRARGDDQKIGDLIAQVTTARIQTFVADDRGDLRVYGLAEPRGSVTLFGLDDKQGRMLQIGGVAEKEKDQVYVRFSARNFVYTLPKKIESLLNTKPNDLRDKHLVRFDPNVLDRITLEAPGKAQTILARKGEGWTIANRKNEPANADEARRLVETLQNEQVAKFADDVASDLAKYGLDKPQLQLTLSSFSSENTAETAAGEHPFATVAFGKIEGDIVYARLGDEPFIIAVRRSLLDNLFVDPIEWQNLAIFKFKPAEVHHLTVSTDQELSLNRTANDQWTWIKGSGTINQVNVRSLLNTLTALRAVRWVGPTAPQHGFEKAPLAITFTTSPDDKAVHKILIGAAAGTGMWHARVDGRDGTFIIANPDLNAFRLPLVITPTPTASPTVSASSSPTASP